MKYRRIKTGLASVVLLLAACAHQPVNGPGLSTELIDNFHSDGMKPPSGMPATLKQQTKGKVVGATALGVAAGVLFGGAAIRVGTRNQPPPEGYIDTAMRATVFEQNEDVAFESPTLALAEALRRKLPGKGIPLSDEGRYSLISTATFWGIDYEKLSEKDNYRVYYTIETALMDNKKVVRQSTCLGATKDMRSLEQWLANDKAEVKRAAAAIGDFCADKMLANLGLGAEPELSPRSAVDKAAP